jgi:RNA polymerase sigma factor (sigma-70 family)
MATLESNPTDATLLRQFARDGSEAALRRLTERHMNLVFGTAARRTGDRGAAQELAQNVFLAMARKAAWLQNETSLAAWLHKTTVLEARQWWRSETRRRQREQTAAQLETTMKTADEQDPALAGMLDEALLELGEGERQALLLRFFEGYNHREVGQALGIGEDAARKRGDKAMDRLMDYFRKRGFAVGSAAAVAAVMAGAAEAAPAGLAAAVARVAASFAGTTPPWLTKLLGMGRTQLAGLCAAVLLFPPAWQEARLLSARAEERRMEALLALGQSERASVAEELTQTRQRLARTEAAAKTASQAAAGSGALDTPWYSWDEPANYVRVPKAVLERLSFDDSEDQWELHNGSGKALDKERSRVSTVVLEVLGLSPAEQERVQEVFSRHLNAYGAWAETNSYLTEFISLGSNLPKLPNGMKPEQVMKLSEDTRVWVTPSVASNGSEWRAQCQQELASVMGEERTAILLRMATDDGSLDECLRRFGAKESLVVVTPRLEGGFWLSQNANGNWLFNTPASFSLDLAPPVEEPFPEAEARREISEKLGEMKAQFPGTNLPPLERIIEDERHSWHREQQLEHFSIVREVLGRPLPQPMVEYLRQWHAAHPEVPDAPNPNLIPKHS